MSEIKYWETRTKIYNYDKLTDDEKQKLRDSYLTEEAAELYFFGNLVYPTIINMEFEFGIKSINLYLHGAGKECKYDIINCIEAIHKKYKDDLDKLEIIKNLVRDNKDVNKYIVKCLLFLDNKLTIEEEEQCLRIIANSKTIDSRIYELKYKPSQAAINKLPPIMTLNVLEILASKPNLSYNIFENLGDEANFKSILFGSVLRYRDRVDSLFSKYKEISNLGVKATIKIKNTCSNCGEYEIQLTSKIVRTEQGLNRTKLRWITENRCLLCGQWSYENSPKLIFIADIDNN